MTVTLWPSVWRARAVARPPRPAPTTSTSNDRAAVGILKVLVMLAKVARSEVVKEEAAVAVLSLMLMRCLRLLVIPNFTKVSVKLNTQLFKPSR